MEDPYDAAMGVQGWRVRIGHVITPHYCAETATTEQHHLLVLLGVDLLFPPIGSLGAKTRQWRILWPRSAEVARRRSTLIARALAGKRAPGRIKPWGEHQTRAVIDYTVILT